MADINKVVITEEVEFDYEEILGLPMPKADIKEACENYIESRYDGGRTLWGYNYKWKYYDETADKMLLLFFYKGQKFGTMQMWDLCGVCFEDDWNENLEDCGQIRSWLKSKIDPKENGDWVWDERVREEKRRKEMEDYCNDND